MPPRVFSEMGDVMVCFSCCVTQRPPRKRRRPIDRSMIGYPTDFKHTGHIGSGDACSGIHVSQLEGQMSSKGGYDHITPVEVQLDCVDLQKS